MGDYETRALALVESSFGYHPFKFRILTLFHNLGSGHCQVGSLTGAVASERVTEAPKGSLKMVGNHLQSVKAQGSLTARLTSRAGTKVGLSELVVEHGIAIT